MQKPGFLYELSHIVCTRVKTWQLAPYPELFSSPALELDMLWAVLQLCSYKSDHRLFTLTAARANWLRYQCNWGGPSTLAATWIEFLVHKVENWKGFERNIPVESPECQNQWRVLSSKSQRYHLNTKARKWLSCFPRVPGSWALEPHRYRSEQQSGCYDPKAIEWSKWTGGFTYIYVYVYVYVNVNVYKISVSIIYGTTHGLTVTEQKNGDESYPSHKMMRMPGGHPEPPEVVEPTCTARCLLCCAKLRQLDDLW